MRKILIIFLALSFILYPLSFPIMAQEDITPTTAKTKSTTLIITPSPTSEKSKIDQLKEKIASTVAQLNLVSKRAFVGKVSKLEKNQITIESGDEVKIIDTDELTKYFTFDKNGKRQDGKGTDLDVGSHIVAIGLYNKDSRKLLARIVLIKEIDIAINGLVKEVDIKGGTITIEDKKKNTTFTIDVEKTTVIRQYNKDTGLVKSGISKVEIGQRAHVHGTPSQEEENRITADRILLLPSKIATTITQGPRPTAPATIEVEKPTATPKPTAKPTAKPKATPTPTETP